MQTGIGDGMVQMERSIEELLETGLVTQDEVDNAH